MREVVLAVGLLTVGLAGVGAAFDALAAPGKHAKIIIEPASSAAAPS